MPAYVDTPAIQRSHGLSGHLIGEPLADAHQVAQAIGLSDRYFVPDALIPHYQLPSGRRDAAIAAGAIPLSPEAWRQQLPRCRRHTTPARERPTREVTPRPAARRSSPPENLDLFPPGP